MHVFFKTAAAAGLAALLLGATPVRTANPIHMLGYLVGRWNCTSNAGGQSTTYTATYSYALGGTWLRAVNSSKEGNSEDLLSYQPGTWRVIDLDATGAAMIMDGHDTGLAHIVMQEKYPQTGLQITFDRQSLRKYTLTFGGTMNGKPAKWQDVCNKA